MSKKSTYETPKKTKRGSANESSDEDTQSSARSTVDSVTPSLVSDDDSSEDIYAAAEIDMGKKAPPNWVRVTTRSPSPTTVQTSETQTQTPTKQEKKPGFRFTYNQMQQLLSRARDLATPPKLRTALSLAAFKLKEDMLDEPHKILPVVVDAITTKTSLGNKLGSKEEQFLRALMNDPKMKEALADERVRDTLRNAAQKLPSGKRNIIYEPLRMAEQNATNAADRPTIEKPTTAETAAVETVKDPQAEQKYSFSTFRVLMKAMTMAPPQLKETVNAAFDDFHKEQKNSLEALATVISATTQTKFGSAQIEGKFLKALMVTSEMENLLNDARGRNELESAAQKLPPQKSEIVMNAVNKAKEKAEAKENRQSSSNK